MRPAASVFAALLLASCGAPAENQTANESVLIDANAVEAGVNGAAAPPPAFANEAEPADTVAATIPEAFQGDYDEKAESCGRPSEYKLKVSAGELRFHESIGTVRSVKVEAPDRIEVFADYQGEGESWQNVRTLRLDDEGRRLTVSGEGTEMVRVRCPAARPS